MSIRCSIVPRPTTRTLRGIKALRVAIKTFARVRDCVACELTRVADMCCACCVTRYGRSIRLSRRTAAACGRLDGADRGRFLSEHAEDQRGARVEHLLVAARAAAQPAQQGRDGDQRRAGVGGAQSQRLAAPILHGRATRRQQWRVVDAQRRAGVVADARLHRSLGERRHRVRVSRARAGRAVLGLVERCHRHIKRRANQSCANRRANAGPPDHVCSVLCSCTRANCNSHCSPAPHIITSTTKTTPSGVSPKTSTSGVSTTSTITASTAKTTPLQPTTSTSGLTTSASTGTSIAPKPTVSVDPTASLSTSPTATSLHKTPLDTTSTPTHNGASSTLATHARVDANATDSKPFTAVDSTVWLQVYTHD
jgi:hypothetical protein